MAHQPRTEALGGAPAARAVARVDSAAARIDTPAVEAHHERSARYPIRSQLLTPLAVVGLLSLLVVAVSHGLLTRRATTARIEQRLQGVVRVLQQSSYPLTDGVLRQMAELSGATLVLADAHGAEIASSDHAVSGDAAPLLRGARLADGRVALGPTVRTSSGAFFHTAVRLRRRPETTQPRTLHVLLPSRDYHSAWRAAFVPPLAVGGLMVAATAVVVNSVAGRVGATLTRLGEAVGRLADGENPAAPVTRWNDETRDFAHAVARAGGRMRRYEADLSRAERVRAVSMLGAGLAHEMRNAATGCRLAIDLHADACRPGEADECLDVARRQLRALESRLQQLLRMGQAPADAPAELIDLAAVAGEAVEVVRPTARHHRVGLAWRAAAPGWVEAPREQLLQSIVNLLLNAVEAASRSRADGAAGAFVRIEWAPAPEVCELRVIDSGDGVELPEGLDCFDPFVSQKPEGVGMGLWVCRTSIEAAGGRLGYHREGEYTVFVIRLPRRPHGPQGRRDD